MAHTVRDLSNQLPTFKSKSGIFNARVLIRIDGIDYDVSHLSTSYDGIIGDSLVVHAKPLEV